MTIDVSVIIVNYHTTDLVINCIKSIFEFTKGLKFEVVIVDNNSDSGFTKRIKESLPDHCEPHLKFLSLSHNIGFGRANNRALEIATGRNILFLNPDTLLLNNAIKILSDFLDHNPKAGACGGNLLNVNNEPSFSFKRILPGVFWEWDELFNTLPQKLIFGRNRFYNCSSKAIKVKMLSGADLMVKKAVLEKINGFDEDYFLYFEDTDLCTRIAREGWKLFNVPEALICHFESESFKKESNGFSEIKIRNYEAGRKTYLGKNASSLPKKISDIIYHLFLSSRTLLVKGKNKREYYKTRRKYFKTK